MGDQLPSVRALAERLVLNPNTVARAYTDLAREGLIESRTGRGVFVIRKRRMFTREEGRRRLEPLVEGIDRRGNGDGFCAGGIDGTFQRELRPMERLNQEEFVAMNDQPVIQARSLTRYCGQGGPSMI